MDAESERNAGHSFSSSRICSHIAENLQVDWRETTNIKAEVLTNRGQQYGNKILDQCIKFHHIYQMKFATISKFCPLHLCRGFKGREITTQKRATYAHFISLMRIGESSVTQESYETVQPLSYYAREKIKQVLESEKLMTSLYPLRFIFIIPLLSHIISSHLISFTYHSFS